MNANRSRPAGAASEAGKLTSILADIGDETPDYVRDNEIRLVGFAEGWNARQSEIDRLNRLADYWYLRANHSSAQIKEFEARRMDDAFKQIEREFFGGAR